MINSISYFLVTIMHVLVNSTIIKNYERHKNVKSNGHLLLDFLKPGLRVACSRVWDSTGSSTNVGNTGCSMADYCIVKGVSLRHVPSYLTFRDVT